MARNTKIQFRRGTALSWTTGIPSPILAEGEIGFEIDSGKFKIGPSGGALWSVIPYAGGSAISGGSGISLSYDSANNLYNIYSVLTSSSSGITLSTGVSPVASGYKNNIELSTILNSLASLSGTGLLMGSGNSIKQFSLSSGTNIYIENANGAGTGPKIGLSNSLSGLTSVYSTTISGGSITGTAISGSNLYIGTSASVSGVDIRNITNSITVTSGVGGLSIGDSFTTSSGITDILKKMLEIVYEPTATAPSVSPITLSGPGGVTNGGSVEVGNVASVIISATFNQGTVFGTGIGGV